MPDKETTKKGPTVSFPLSSPRGTQDILPQEQKYWEYVTETAELFLRGWHFQPIELPIFEELALFQRAVGGDTDIVQKEMFELKVRGKGAHYALRPEGTASMVRAYIEHGMRSWPRPVKVFTIGPFFRYERPQAGRLRQFHQVDMEVFGSAAPITDVEVIYILHLLFRQLGLEDYVVHLNTLGVPKERKEYIKLLKDHYRRNKTKMCRDCKVRLTTNPLRLLDCKEEKCQQLANTAPRLLDHISEESKKHFDYVMNTLEQLQVPFQVTPGLVRGLDYYTHTVFEFVPKVVDGQAHATFASGGRYDLLVKELGGRETSAVGAAIGIERVVERIKEEGIELTVTDQPRIYIAQLGDQAKVVALQIMKELREADIPFAESIDRDGMQAQLKMADRLKVDWALILGQKEVIDSTVILRNMESGMQEVVDREKLVSELQRRLNLI
ncbi:MAG: histidine--tRNA ligase [Candidatus Andersenbacteria bacterium]